MAESGNRRAGVRFFLLFFVGHLAVTAAYWAALRQLPEGTAPISGGLFGLLMTPALNAFRHGGSMAVAVVVSIFNSLVMAGVATLVYRLIRKLRAA